MVRIVYLGVIAIGVAVLNGGCDGSVGVSVPRAIVFGVVRTPAQLAFGGADVKAYVFINGQGCAGVPLDSVVTQSADDGGFELTVRGQPNFRTQQACVNVAALPPGTSGYVPGYAWNLEVTLRTEEPLERVMVEIELNRPPPP